jgi:hypothetical protein
MSRIKLVATEGMVYTNGTDYARVAYLCSTDSPDNWWEIPEAEYEAIMQEQASLEADPATDADYRAALREMGVKV